MKKLLSLVICLALLCPLLCSGARAADASELPFVELDWYLGDGSPAMPDAQLVNDAVNAYIEPLINAHVNIHYMSPDEYKQKVPTMIMSGMDTGIMTFGTAFLNYVVEAQRNALLPLDQLLESYAPDVKALFSDADWDAMRVNGNIYGIPTLKDNAYIISLMYNNTMAQALGLDMDQVHFNTFQELKDFFYEVKEKRDSHPQYKEFADLPICEKPNYFVPFYFAVESFMTDNYTAVCNVPKIMQLAGYDENTVVNLYETPEFRDACLTIQKFVEDNIYTYEEKYEWFGTGGVFTTWTWGRTYLDEDSLGDFKSKMLTIQDVWKDTTNLQTAGTCISVNCKEPERAMMFLNLVNTDPKLATMLRFGVEGTHYVLDGDGKVSFDGTRNEDPNNRGYYYWYGASIGNLTIVNANESLAGPDNIMLKNMRDFNQNAVASAHMGFVLDTTPIANEIAACNSVIAEFQTDLLNGYLDSADDVNASIDEFVAKLKANGSEKITAEVQRQLDEFRAGK